MCIKHEQSVCTHTHMHSTLSYTPNSRLQFASLDAINRRGKTFDQASRQIAQQGISKLATGG